MPFICTYQLNNGAIQPSDEVVFIEFTDTSFGMYQATPVKIAKVLFNGQPAYIYSNSPGFPSSKGNLHPGDKINAETPIAYFSADGEDIPYNKPYAVIGFE
ncbi:MAG: hypothetical protein QM731_09210 [Chitinophagaceae bacterium]